MAGRREPAAGLAQQLRTRGHEVAFAGYPDQASRFAGLGFTFCELTGASAGWGPVDPDTVMDALVAHVWASAAHAADLRSVVDRGRPDLVVIDCLMGGLLGAAEALSVPTAVLVHSAPGALCPPGGFMDGLVTTPLNAVRGALGLAPVDGYWDAWRPHPVLVASVPELDPLAPEAPYQWIGPVFEEVGDAGSLPTLGRPLVLVSFSSGPAWDQTSRIQRTIDGLADLDVGVLVTCGAVDPARLRVPDGVVAVPALPHAAVLPSADAVVTHAGHGTLTAALAHGLPVVTLPNLAADQPALSSMAAAGGFGLALDGEAATPAEIRDAVQRVLGEPAFSAAARGLAARIDTYREAPVAAVERLLGPRGS